MGRCIPLLCGQLHVELSRPLTAKCSIEVNIAYYTSMPSCHIHQHPTQSQCVRWTPHTRSPWVDTHQSNHVESWLVNSSCLIQHVGWSCSGGWDVTMQPYWEGDTH